MVIAFWNINNNTDLADLLIDFVKEYGVDILFLAESDYNPKSKRKTTVNDIVLDFIIKSKSKNLERNFEVVNSNGSRIKVLSSYSSSFFDSKHKFTSGTRWSAYYLQIPSVINLNLFPVHFHAKNNWSDNSQALECVNFSRDINKVEETTGCENSILIGDFNMNPFELGLIGSNALNAIQDLDYGSKNPEGREIDGSYYRYFYNPMWNKLGDNELPSGTYYYRSSGHASYDWQMFDQVIVRPSLKPLLTKESIKIVTSIGTKKLLSKTLNRPEEQYSDHLPILIELKL